MYSTTLPGSALLKKSQSCNMQCRNFAIFFQQNRILTVTKQESTQGVRIWLPFALALTRFGSIQMQQSKNTTMSSLVCAMPFTIAEVIIILSSRNFCCELSFARVWSVHCTPSKICILLACNGSRCLDSQNWMLMPSKIVWFFLSNQLECSSAEVFICTGL